MVGNGRWRQMGMFGFGVGVGMGVGVGFGVGANVGSGTGGTRGSGKCGSPAAESAWDRFQSGPYDCGVAFGAGVTACGITDCSVCSVAWPITRFPMRSPSATATRSTMAPAARTMVANRVEGCMARNDYTRANGRMTSSLAARARRSLGFPIKCTSRNSPGAISTRAVCPRNSSNTLRARSS